MAKLGFVVGHPTQFETPFYQYISEHHGSDTIMVYYYNYSEEGIQDKELGSHLHNKWGLDLKSGYSWRSVIDKPWKNAKSILRENQYVIINGYTSLLAMALFLIAAFYHRKVGMKLDTVPWNNKGVLKKLFKAIVFRVLSLVVDMFWVTGSKSKEFLLSIGIPNSKIKVFSYVIDSQWFKRESMVSATQRDLIFRAYGVSLGHKVILTIVKLVKRETPEDLIKAFGKCMFDQVTLVIVGDGDLRGELEQKGKKWANGKEIIFTGYVPYLQLPRLYGIADLYVHTSENEPWGVSVQEALACGLPVITSQFVGSAYDLLHLGQNGMMYTHGNVVELALRIRQMLRLRREDVREENNRIMILWNYDSTWNEVEGFIDQCHKTPVRERPNTNKAISR